MKIHWIAATSIPFLLSTPMHPSPISTKNYRATTESQYTTNNLFLRVGCLSSSNCGLSPLHAATPCLALALGCMHPGGEAAQGVTSVTNQPLVVSGEIKQDRPTGQGRCEAGVGEHSQQVRGRPGNGNPKLEQFKPPWNCTLTPEQAFCRGKIQN